MIKSTSIAMRYGRFLSLVCLLVSCGLIGCSGNGTQRVALTGEVLLDGKPVENASIIFTPKSAGLAAAAIIRDGKFNFGLDDGPSVGEYDVRINPSDAELEEANPTELAKANRRPRIPKVYQAQGRLNVKVTGEPNQLIKLTLTSKP